MELSANTELLFTEAGDDFADCVSAAADAGITTIEIRQHSNKDLKALRAVLENCESRVWTLIVENRAPLADREIHKGFLEQAELACRAANTLGCPHVVTSSGTGFPFMRRPQQSAIVVEALRAGAEIAVKQVVVLTLESLNTRADHPGILFDRSSDCIQALRAIDQPWLGLLYDVHHSLQMQESPADELRGNIDLVSHI